MSEHILGQSEKKSDESTKPIVMVEWNGQRIVGRATREDIDAGVVHDAMAMIPVPDNQGNVQIQAPPPAELHLEKARGYIWYILTDKSPFYQGYVQMVSGITIAPANSIPQKNFNPPTRKR